MPSIERTAYPRFKKPFSPQELDELYLPTEGERRFVARHAQGKRQRLTLLALLKGHQHLGYLPATDAIPNQIRRYLCSALALDESTRFSDKAQRSRRRYRHAIRAFLDVKPFSEGGKGIVRHAAREAPTP